MNDELNSFVQNGCMLEKTEETNHQRIQVNMNNMNVVSDVSPSVLSSMRSTPDIYMARKIDFQSEVKNYPA